MADTEPKITTPKGTNLSGEIRPWVRILLALASAGSAVIGYFAIMRANTPEVGGVAFVALAGLFAVLAVIGRVPLKVNAGSVGVEFGEAAKLVEASEDIPPTSRAEFAERLQAQGDSNPTYRVASDAILASVDFERLVVEILEANGWVDRDFDNSLRKYANTGLDLVIRIEGRRFGVMIKATRRLMQSSDAARLLQAAKRLKLYGAVIIIPDQALNVDALRVLDGVLVVPVSRIKHLPELLR